MQMCTATATATANVHSHRHHHMVLKTTKNHIYKLIGNNIFLHFNTHAHRKVEQQQKKSARKSAAVHSVDNTIC